MKKRILSLLLALLMVVTLVPTAALADTEMTLNETVEYVKTDDNESAVFTFTPPEDGEYQLYVRCPYVQPTDGNFASFVKYELFVEYEDNGATFKRKIHTDNISTLLVGLDKNSGELCFVCDSNFPYEMMAGVKYRLSFGADFTGTYTVTVKHLGTAAHVAKVDETSFPDENFRSYVSNYCDFNGDGKLSENEITRAKTLYIDNLNIASIDGIENFTSLTSLHCSGNQLEEMPELPESLTSLYCSDNQLTELPANLSKLENLWALSCSDNQITALPALSANLRYIYCSGNKFTALPTLPENLQVLNCSDNPLTDLPTLPANLTRLYCRNHQLTTLPTLPENLQVLDCSGNLLTDLPTLPANLTGLYCSGNKFTVLPTLPENLQALDCSDNPLTVLPELPSTLEYLRCNDNELTALPKLPPTLETLQCASNLLTVLPELPSTLTNLHCSDNQLTTLPELPTSLNILFCNDNNFKSIALNPDADYSIIHVFNNSLPDYSAVTGKDIMWNDSNFIFGAQNHEHNFVIQEKVDATCSDYGYMLSKCSKCDAYASKDIKPSAHDFGEDNKCSMCGGYICMLTNELHKFNDEGVCTICGNSIPEPYTAEDGSVWTLTKDGVLTISGAKSVNSYSEAMEYFKPFLQNTLKIVCADGTTVFESYYKFSKVKELSLGKDVQTISSPHSLNSLEKVTVYAENPYLCAEGGVLYSKDGSKLLLYPKILGGTWSESITVKEGVTSIEDLAFYNHAVLKHLILPESLVNIGAQAFLYCYSLESVSIPSSTTSIGYRAFYGCNSLTDVYYSGTEEQWNAISIDDDNDCIASLTINYNHEHSYENGVCTECGASDGTATILGDLNGDKKVDISDLIRLKKYIADSSTEINGSADLNGDNDVNILDLIRLKKMIAGGDI